MKNPNERERDFFAAMAAGTAGEAGRERPAMEAVPAPEPPSSRLAIDNDATVVDPPAHDKLDSAEKLAARVAELRRQYEPFLRDLTPPDPLARPRQGLAEFDFRFEEAEDRAEAQRPYGEDGAWERVRLPHYTGPAGRWAAYYRTAFRLTEAVAGAARIWVCFGAADYIAEVFVNGCFVGRHEGIFAPFAFDITDRIQRAGDNVLLVRIENDAIHMSNASWKPWKGYNQPVPPEYQLDGDKVYAASGQGWDAPEGWSHCPPGAGLWQGVHIEGRAVLSVTDLFVRPLPEKDRFELWLETWRSEFSKCPTAVELTVYPNNFTGTRIDLGRRELAAAGPNASLYKIAFELPEARRWTPDEPFLYTLRVRLVADEESGPARDSRDGIFGMRHFTQDTASPRKGRFYLNGEPVVLRGTNEMGNLSVPVQQGNRERAIGDLLIGKAAHLNFWRITQRPVQPEVYDLCDRLGVLVQTDLPLFAGVRVTRIEETARQAGEMERLVRSHPCAVVSSFLNEPSPDAWKPDKAHRLADRPTMESFFEVCILFTRLHNPDRVIKCVDGDYDPPPRHGMLDLHAYACMHEDHGVEVGVLHKGGLFSIKEGWMCGVGEYGAEGMEPIATMRRHYPQDWLPENDDDPDWMPDRIPMCQAWGWHHQWYERPDTFADWVGATHHHQAWAVRFMHEAFRRRADIIPSTAIHLLVNAWPNNWLKALCSFDRVPLPGYFALADANTPVAVNVRTDRHAVFAGDEVTAEIWALNDTPGRPEGLQVIYRATLSGRRLFANRCALEVGPISARALGRLCFSAPDVVSPTPMEIHASLVDAAGRIWHDHMIRLMIFPPVDRHILAGRAVGIVGEHGGRAWRLAAEFGGTPRLWDETLAADGGLVIADTTDLPGAVATWVAGGGCLLGLAQPGGSEWRIGPHGVTVRKMVGHQFASRKTGHPAVDGLDPFHFSLWYDRGRDRIGHLLDSCLEGAGMSPITLTGHGIWYTKKEDLAAGAELRHGRGRILLDQIRAAERMAGEPRAALYLERLLGYAAGK